MTRRSILMGIFLAGLMVTAAWAGLVRVSWDANTESDLAGYKLYMRHESNPSYDWDAPAWVTDNPLATSYEGLNLPDNGGRYYFVLTAYDTSGNESGPSNEVSYLTPDTIPPAPPHCNAVVGIP